MERQAWWKEKTVTKAQQRIHWNLKRGKFSRTIHEDIVTTRRFGKTHTQMKASNDDVSFAFGLTVP